MRCSTMAEAETTPATNPFDRYQSYPAHTFSRAPRVEPDAKPTPKPHQDREERNATPWQKRRPMRGLGKKWEERRFTATFQGISYRWNTKTNEQDQYLDLTDVHMDGVLLTLNWSMPLIPRMRGLFSRDGETVTFEAQINRTASPMPVLRGPFRKVTT